jgi:hypothetical protein
MTQDEIIEMYMQVSKELCNDTEWCWAGVGEPLQMFAKLVAAKEREALAQEKTLQALHSENERLGLYKDAYAQPEQEPSGHFLDFAYSDSIAYVHVYDQFTKGQQFYKSLPQRIWVGLTDEEVRKICVNEWGGYEQCRAIEAKLKEKNFA